MTEFKGATAGDWMHFDMVLGLGESLLPSVPAGDDVKVLKGSALEGKIGKIPSQFNHSGEAHGLKDWQRREIMSNEVVAWSKDRRLNLCVRLGAKSGIYAFDVDIDNEAQANAVDGLIYMGMDSLNRAFVARRTRENSHKLLIPFRMDTPCKKRKIKLDDKPTGPAIELLADGQQFVACGSHSSGARYQWLPSLPDQIPTLTMDQVNRIWTTLTKTYATTASKQENLTASAQDGQTTTAESTKGTSSPSAGSAEWTVHTSCSEGDWSQLLSALRFLTDKVADNDTWSEVGYALLSLQGSRPAQQLWEDFSKKAVGYVEGGATAWWGSHRTQTPRTDYRHVLTMARQRGMANVADPEAFPPVQSEKVHSEAEQGDSGSAGGHGAQPAGASQLISVASDLLSDAPIRPLIQLSEARYTDIVDEMEAALVPDVYTQGPHLVRRSQAHSDAEIKRSEDAVMLINVTKEWLAYHLGEICVWQKYLKGDANWVATKPSIEHINTLWGMKGWTQLRPLDAISRSPFVRPDGSICDTAGYDRRARVLYVPSTEFPAIPTDPDIDCARAALGRIRAVFDEFPYSHPEGESAFLSHILTEAARVAIPHSPMFFYDAPSAGTGKSLLQEMAARIVHGTEPANRTWVGDGDEVRKVLYASLLSGDRSIWFDNIPTGHKTRSPELCSFLTSSTWTDRKLGVSETLGIPNKCVLVGSGNNVTPTGDLARRSLVIRLDANTEKLKERVFKIPEGMLRPYVMEHRPQLLVDALTIIKAFHAAKDIPKMPVALVGYGPWSHYCRDPLIWLGMPDPVLTQSETDDETGSVGNIYETLFANFGSNEFTGLDVARLVNGITDSTGELASALSDNGCKEPHIPKSCGYWLRGCKDRISYGYKLEQTWRDGRKGQRWRIIRMNEDLT